MTTGAPVLIFRPLPVKLQLPRHKQGAENGAGLSKRLRDSIVLAGAVVAPSNHGDDAARAAFHCNHRGLGMRPLVGILLSLVAWSQQVFYSLQSFVDGFDRSALKLRIDRCIHAEAVVDQGVV